MVNTILEVCREICALCDPARIILFGQKLDVNTAQVREFSLCVLVDTSNKHGVVEDIYLSVECETSFNLLVYTPSEWVALMEDTQSYAYRIVQKGSTVYERPIQQ